MFNKKKCPKCKSKINKDFDFCPYCGNNFCENNFNESDEDWGILGKNDFIQSQDPFQEMFGGGMLNKMLGSAMKMLERELQKEMKQAQEQPASRTNFELYINGKKINPKNIQVTKQPIRQIQKQPARQQVEFSEENLKKLSKLPRKEPATNVKRFADKLIYEIKVPGVKSIKDVSIVQLENSIEIKAIGKDKIYSKLIPMSLPIINYKLEKNILVLELENRG